MYLLKESIDRTLHRRPIGSGASRSLPPRARAVVVDLLFLLVIVQKQKHRHPRSYILVAAYRAAHDLRLQPEAALHQRVDQRKVVATRQ